MSKRRQATWPTHKQKARQRRADKRQRRREPMKVPEGTGPMNDRERGTERRG